jgi:hypothetical protein
MGDWDLLEERMAVDPGTPEEHLWAAVLQMAIIDYRAECRRCVVAKRLNMDLVRATGIGRWMLTSQDAGVGSFRWICGWFGIDVEQARERLGNPPRSFVAAKGVSPVVGSSCR